MHGQEKRKRQPHSLTPAEMRGIIEVYDRGQTVFITPVYSSVPDDGDFKLHQDWILRKKKMNMNIMVGGWR